MPTTTAKHLINRARQRTHESSFFMSRPMDTINYRAHRVSYTISAAVPFRWPQIVLCRTANDRALLYTITTQQGIRERYTTKHGREHAPQNRIDINHQAGSHKVGIIAVDHQQTATKANNFNDEVGTVFFFYLRVVGVLGYIFLGYSLCSTNDVDSGALRCPPHTHIQHQINAKHEISNKSHCVFCAGAIGCVLHIRLMVWPSRWFVCGWVNKGDLNVNLNL